MNKTAAAAGGAIIGSTAGMLIFNTLGLLHGGIAFIAVGLCIMIVGAIVCFATHDNLSESKMVFWGEALIILGVTASILDWLPNAFSWL